jgi:hypothetical protein
MLTMMSKKFALGAVFLGILAGIVAAEDDTPKKIPTAYVGSGGGFHAMTTNMGFARAMAVGNVLPLLTHAGSNSGGTWFLTQLAFSKPFYENVTGVSGGTISKAVADWGLAYAAAMRDAVNNTIQPFQPREHPYCKLNGTLISGLITTKINDLEKEYFFPASNWYDYIADMLEPYIPNIRSKTFSAPREGLPNTTLTISLSLGPDIYDNTGKQAQLKGVTAGGYEVPPNVLPISFSAKAGENGVWSLPSIASSLTVSHGWGRNKTVVPLGLSSNASIAEINAGSSAAAGAFGSPTLVRRSHSPVIASPPAHIFLMQTMCLFMFYRSGISYQPPWIRIRL